MVGRSTGVVCRPEEVSSLALLDFILILSLEKSAGLLFEITWSARAEELVGTTGAVCLVSKM